MSFVSPQFDQQESSGGFFVYSIDFKYDRSPILIFNLPETIQISISGIYLLASAFDYLNPLFITSRDKEKVRFYDTVKKEFVDTFPCFTVQSALLKDFYESLSKQSIYYCTCGQIISYDSYKIYPALEGTSMYDILSKLRTGTRPPHFNPTLVFPQSTTASIPVFNGNLSQWTQQMQHLYSTVAMTMANQGPEDSGTQPSQEDDFDSEETSSSNEEEGLESEDEE